MKQLSIILCIAVFVILHTACQGSTTALTDDAPPQIPTIVVEPSATPTFAKPEPAILPTDTPLLASPTLEPTSLPLDLRPQYIITATLDYAWRNLKVEQKLVIPNTSRDTIHELTLVVQTNWRPGAFNLTKFTLGNETPVSYNLDGIRLRGLLIDPLEPGEILDLFLAYEINIPPLMTSEDFGPNPFGYTTRQVNLTDWYPFVPPYIDGAGWLVHNPWYYGEHLVYPVADFDVTIQLVNAPASSTIAASALDVGEDDIHRYHLEKARNFVWSVSPEYRVHQAKVDDITILGYSFPFDAVPGEAAFKATVNALELYSQLFGSYPFDGMTIIEADFDHGMEYSGLFFLSKAFYSTYDGSPSTYLVSIAAHETAHQWWYGLVGNDQALEPWLDEALCTYSEKLFYEHLYPQSLDWWDYVRVDYYEPSGWVDSSIYNTTGYRPYRDAVYLNGARFLDELRVRVGEETFSLFLREYVQINLNRIATAEDFFTILRMHSNADWNDLLSKYFENP